ncbi:MAG: hypothetical protein ABIR59_07195 [Gemmatimonadales bacterium]
MTTRLAVAAIVAVAVVVACAGPDGPESAAVDSRAVATAIDSGADTAPAPTVVLVDSGQPPAAAGADGWNYHRTASVDLDGDGTLERVVIAARVEMVRGRPTWDDGQQWQVYVEEADSFRTLVYARRLQLGTLSLRLEAGPAGAPRRMVLMEHLPDRLAVYEVSYRGPTDFSAAVGYQRALDPTGELASSALP